MSSTYMEKAISILIELDKKAAKVESLISDITIELSKRISIK
jgi:hypothetical protein